MAHKKAGRKIASGYRKAMSSGPAKKLRRSKLGGLIRKATGQKTIQELERETAHPSKSNGHSPKSASSAAKKRGVPKHRTATPGKDTHGHRFAPNVISGGSKLTKKKGVWR